MDFSGSASSAGSLESFSDISVLFAKGASFADDTIEEEALSEIPQKQLLEVSQDESGEKGVQSSPSLALEETVNTHLGILESAVSDLITSHDEIASKLQATEEALQERVRANNEMRSECERLEKEIDDLAPSLQLFNKTVVEIAHAKMNQQQLLAHLDSVTKATRKLEKEAVRLQEEEARNLDMEASSTEAQINELMAEYDAREAELESACLAEIQLLIEENEMMLADEEQRNEEVIVISLLTV
jgi:chromosome segregation ATPase